MQEDSLVRPVSGKRGELRICFSESSSLFSPRLAGDDPPHVVRLDLKHAVHELVHCQRDRTDWIALAAVGVWDFGLSCHGGHYISFRAARLEWTASGRPE